VTPPQPALQLLVVGLGRVSRRLLELLDDTRERLPFTWTLTGVCSRSLGAAFEPAGLDPRLCLAAAAAGARLSPPSEGHGLRFLDRALRELRAACGDGYVVVVETTVLDAVGGEPATSHVRAALAAGAHVVTANKGPAAFAYHELAAQADRAGRAFLFESAVMDGVPVFSLVADTLPAVRVRAFRGVVNTTCGYILAAMARGESFAGALREMQAQGIAEADPSLDVDGWDAAAKAAVMANAWLDARITPHDVIRAGIRDLGADALREAAAAGQRLRLVSSGRRDGDRVEVHARPVALPDDDPLAAVSGLENALYLTTDLLGEVGIVQRDGGLTQTAYGLLADLSRVARRMSA
jgi:homoserine dehydrogenase